MLAAMIGDYVGSRFEFKPHKSKDFRLIHEDCRFTDDSVMTAAVASACLKILAEKKPGPFESREKLLKPLARETVREMQKFGRMFPEAGYGPRFEAWLKSPKPEPYYSFGNGAVMRLSPAAYFARDLREAEELAEAVTAVTHDHPEALKAAKALASAMQLALRGRDKEEIRDYISAHYYPLDKRLDEIRGDYIFDVSCQGSVPEAFLCFFEAESFEDTLRNAVSLGGDSDTMAACAGALAGVYYGIPGRLRQAVEDAMPEALKPLLRTWEEKAGRQPLPHHVLCKYIGKLGQPGRKRALFKKEAELFFEEQKSERLWAEAEAKPEDGALILLSEPESAELLKQLQWLLEGEGDTDWQKAEAILLKLRRFDRADKHCRLSGLTLLRKEKRESELELYEFNFSGRQSEFRAETFADGGEQAELPRLYTPLQSLFLRRSLDGFERLLEQHECLSLCPPEAVAGTPGQTAELRFEDGSVRRIYAESGVPEDEPFWLRLVMLAAEASKIEAEAVKSHESPADELRETEALFAAKKAEYDELRFIICPDLEIRYYQAVGKEELRVFALDLEISRLRRHIALVTAALNRREQADFAAIEITLEIEFQDYKRRLEERSERYDRASNISPEDVLSGDEVREMKQIYYRLVKKLHPDLHPDATEEELELFRQAAEAYKSGNRAMLKILEEQAGGAEPLESGHMDAEQMLARISRLNALIEILEEKIQTIKTSYPYDKRWFVYDEVMIEAKRRRLEAAAREMEAVRDSLKARLDVLIKKAEADGDEE